MKIAPAKNKNKRPARRKIKDNSFPVVAIGASAGGLEAVTQLLKNLAPNTGMAFIYVQHLSPDHKSFLTSLLSKLTLMKVQEVKNKMLMEPDNVYIIPPDKEMIAVNGHIKLIPRTKERAGNLPIDTFFCSLAIKHKKGAIGIILSGSATDGTRGLSAIKEAGGLTFAQDDSARFSSMPKSAIAAGAVDFVLSPKEIARELTRLGKQEYVHREMLVVGKENEIDDADSDLKMIIDLLHKETGVDFSHYKTATIKRRILRRLMLYKIKTLAEYARLITNKNDEINILFQDLLIHVTGFFRDNDAHQYLKSTLFPRMLSSKAAGETLRLWISACSTGEEAYSIAMGLLEIQKTKPTSRSIQIFATDLSAQAIAKARLGEYSEHELKSVSLKRRQQFYTRTGSHYRISKVVRDMCVFAPHNILRDPPFSRVDFISCCNLLIYLDSVAQKKVMATFHYALNSGGYLMLGKSETIGASGHLFTHIHNKFKIYTRKKNSVKRALPDLPHRFSNTLKDQNIKIKPVKNNPVPDIGFDSTIDAILLSRYVPASIVINHAMEIVQFRGPTDFYLRPSGRASLHILKMIPPEIAFELRHAISKSIKSKETVRKEGIEMKGDTGLRMITIEVIPVNVEPEEPLLLILFTETGRPEGFLQQDNNDHFPKGRGKNERMVNGTKDRKIETLRKELMAARADMHSFAQDQEAFNEQLQNANEEVVSSNEELQSVNEELETSKEEIEATNEELITTNQELRTRNDLLNESYDYSEAIISTIHEPMIILDKDLRVKSANESFYNVFQVTSEETEKTLLYDLGDKQWDIPSLRELLEDIIPKNTRFHDFEVTHTFRGIGKKIMLLNARRIVQKTHGERLILLAVNDITERTLLQVKEKELLKKDIRESKSYGLALEHAVEERTMELEQANQKLGFQNEEIEKRASELILANRELAFQNEEKEKRASELILANRELAFQNEEKEKRAAELINANAELEAFSYVSSHDLQEPLRKIQTFSLRILETENQNLSAKGKDYFNRMKMAANRMQKLIEDLLAFSHLNIAERKYEYTDLNTILEEVKSDFKETMEEKHAIIEATDLPRINIIAFQFRQLVHNLIGNALKFSNPERPPRIMIKSRIEKGNKLDNEKLLLETEYCHISVSDNGIGFDAQYKDRVFEVFQKLHGREEFAGTGIGLAIVKKIAENHNGVVTVASHLNQGATFHIYIPVS